MTDPHELLDKAWSLLRRGAADKKHAYATPVVATVSPDGVPRTRTVVLRRAVPQAGELWCYTDRRSVKARHVDAGAITLAWTFWDRRAQLQVNAVGPARWLDAAAARSIFASMPRHSRKAYATLAAPGQSASGATDGLPDDWADKALADTDYAAAHFGVLVTRVQTLDILQLDRAGHRRARAERRGGGFVAEWLIP